MRAVIAELNLSRYLPNRYMSDLFRDFSLTLFVDGKWNFGTSESASSNRRTKLGSVNMPGAVVYVIITWAETKIHKVKMKWIVQVFLGFSR